LASSELPSRAEAESWKAAEPRVPKPMKIVFDTPGYEAQPLSMSSLRRKDESDEYAFEPQPMSSPWIALHMSGGLKEGPSNMKILAFVGAACLVIVFIFIAVHGEGGDEQTEAKTYADLCALKFNEGTWAQTFRDAEGSKKEALELLYRCNIIPQQEFACSVVSEPHIDECLWIASHMLKQKSLEEWVGSWQQAKRAFEDNVSACFTARTDMRSRSYGPESLTSDNAVGDPHQEIPQYRPDTVIDSNASTVVEIGEAIPPPVTAPRLPPTAQAPLSPTGPSSKPSTGPSPRVISSRDSTGQNLLIMRCREIMSQVDRDRPSSQRLTSSTASAVDAAPEPSPADGVSERAPH